jgi:hypothetical protein
VAEGKAPIHGKVGKRRQRAAEKAALAVAGATPAPRPVTVNSGTGATAPQVQVRSPAVPQVRVTAS